MPATEPYSGEYQDQITIPSKDIEFFAEAKGATLAEVIQAIAALSSSVKTLEATVKGIERSLWSIPIIVAIMLFLFSIFF